MNRLLLFLCGSLLTLFAFTCSKPNEPPPPPTTPQIQLTAIDIQPTQVKLQITILNSNARKISLSRNGSIFLTISLSRSDTIILDKRLQQNTSYIYKAILLQDTLIVIQSAALQLQTPLAPPPDTTSHNYSFETLFFGDAQSAFYDVYAVSDTNVWAVGWLFVRDSTGKLDTDHPYNTAHWDGKKWELVRVPFRECPYQTTYPSSISSVSAFSFQRIFFIGRGLPTVKYETYYDTECQLLGIPTGSPKKLWAQTDKKVYICGTNGWICFRNDGSYTNQTTPTTKDLTDIYGNGSEIWSVGGYQNKNEGIVLLNTGNGWQKVDSLSNNETFAIHSVWCDAKGFTQDGFMILAGRGIKYYDTTWKEPPEEIVGGNLGLGKFFFNSVRGSNKKNVFAAGIFGIVLHYNGATWAIYSELLRYPEGRWLQSVSVTDKQVFIVGQQDDKGIVIRGVKK